MKKLGIVGGVGLDIIVRPDGPEEILLGGSAWYASLAASHFCPVELICTIGGDFPEEGWQALRKRRIGLGSVEFSPGGRSFAWKAAYAENPDERRTLEIIPGVEADFQPSLPDGLDAVFVANCHPRLQKIALSQARAIPLVALDTIDRWIELESDLLWSLLPMVDVFFINAHEARQLSDCQDLPMAATRILKAGPLAVVVKNGSAGAQIFTPSGVADIPPRPARQVVDTTGAGDTFAGALLASLVKRSCQPDLPALARAARIGAAVASFKVENLGATQLFLDRLPPDIFSPP